MADWFLTGVVKCAECGEKIWFSPEGYIVCSCRNFERQKIGAASLESALIENINQKLLNDDGFIERLTSATNAALGPAGKMSKKAVAQSIINQFESIFSSNNSANKRKLTLTFIKSASLLRDNILEIEFNQI